MNKEALQTRIYEMADIRFRMETPFSYIDTASFQPFYIGENAAEAADGQSETVVRFRFDAPESCAARPTHFWKRAVPSCRKKTKPIDRTASSVDLC